MDELEKHICAWSMEWEGTVVIGRHNKHQTSGYLKPMVHIANTRKELLERFFEIVKVGRIIKVGVKNRPNNKKLFMWYIEKPKEIMDLLREIKPYFITKGEQADIMIEFCERRLNGYRCSQGDWDLYWRLREIHKHITYRKMKKKELSHLQSKLV